MQDKRVILGKIFFTLSILFLFYTLITPLNHLVCQIDEYFTMTITGLPVADIITVTAGDVHPPLYYLMAKVVVEISNALGLDVLFNLKLLTILAFVLITVISATVIRKQYGWLSAGIFAFALSVMADFSRYHIIARMYSWTILFILVAFLAFGNIINKRDVKKSWAVLTLFSVMAAYTHYYGAITAVCIYLILFVYIIKDRKDEIKNWLISVVAGIILYLPWVFAVISQLMKINEGFIFPPLTLMDVIKYLGYYVTNENLIFTPSTESLILAIVSIAFLIVIIAFYLREKDSFSKEDKVLILAAMGAYFGTIFIGVLVSELLNPILDGRYLMPAAALMWLAISVILAKIKNKRSFLIVFILVAALLLIGVAYTAETFDNNYHQGMLEKEYFDNISNDNNSILIIGTENDLMFFLCYSKYVDTYCLNVSDVFGLPSSELHRQYNYTDINESQIDEFISNNTDKNIYFMYWNNTSVKSPIESEVTYLLMHYTKINTSNVTAQPKTTTFHP